MPGAAVGDSRNECRQRNDGRQSDERKGECGRNEGDVVERVQRLGANSLTVRFPCEGADCLQDLSRGEERERPAEHSAREAVEPSRPHAPKADRDAGDERGDGGRDEVGEGMSCAFAVGERQRRDPDPYGSKQKRNR